MKTRANAFLATGDFEESKKLRLQQKGTNMYEKGNEIKMAKK